MSAPSRAHSHHPEMLGVGPVEWDSETERAHRRYQRKASTIHGWVVKMRGTLFGSESTRRAGIREMREAAAIRRYKKEHPEQFRGRAKSGGVFWIFPRRSTRSRSHRRHDHRDDRHHRSHSRRDDRHRDRRDHRERPNAYYGERDHGPCLHFHHRVKPHHHGHGTYLAGVLTGNHHLREKGRELKERAAKERRRERRRRKRQRRDEALALKYDAVAGKNRWWHR
ncbi:hypothetical protein BD309DRAFT_997213 [Dichomitus squalens]|uniref:Uncharacterized protein n=1 Tax=Dichomitus squalens TaxID=114155 RepID=A0A4Q9PA91_9APHY|nr:hypothetical protein BD311DRAFT_868761 [Dichomitus squalens]TBU49026.1 hypothetical protein BD309DRAFT_997213 [Dichomitus squalens]TBU64117.1 hypothetical protein BD310DRAFT_1035288 [Dichomitus squalens]